MTHATSDRKSHLRRSLKHLMQWKTWRRIGLYTFVLIVYLASTVPVGLLIYSIKTEVGLDIFRDGGFHAFTACLSRSFPLSRLAEPPTAPALKQLELLARDARATARAATLKAREYEHQALKLRRQELQKHQAQ
jgi:hypothetical protein